MDHTICPLCDIVWCRACHGCSCVENACLCALSFTVSGTGDSDLEVLFCQEADARTLSRYSPWDVPL